MNETRLHNLLGALVLGLDDRMTQAVASASGLQRSAAAALVLLGQTPGLSIDALAQILGLAHSSTVRLVEQLVAREEVSRSPGTDRRQVLLQLTVRGQSSVNAILDARQRALEQALETLPAAAADGLVATCDALLTTLSTDTTAASRLCRLCDEAACGMADCPVERAYRLHVEAASPSRLPARDDGS